MNNRFFSTNAFFRNYRSARFTRCAGSKIAGTPLYSPNAWVEFDEIFAGSASGEYFQGHRGDFLISSWNPRYGAPQCPPWGPSQVKKWWKFYFFQIDFFLMKSCSLVSKTSLKPIFDQVSSVFRPKIPFSLQGNVQVSSKCKMCRTFFEPTAPTDQTEYSRSMKFGMVTPYGNRRGVIEAIFDISPLTREGWGTPGGS